MWIAGISISKNGCFFSNPNSRASRIVIRCTNFKLFVTNPGKTSPMEALTDLAQAYGFHGAHTFSCSLAGASS
jgi:hypothetical protein